MNSWIERNIIFPRINQLILQQEHSLHPPPQLPVTTRRAGKKASLNFNLEPQSNRKNNSTHLIDASSNKPRKYSQIRMEGQLSEGEENQTVSAIKKRIKILELLDNHRDKFQFRQSKIIKKKEKRRGGTTEKYAEKNAESNFCNPILNLQKSITKKKELSFKWKTEPAECSIFETEREIASHRSQCLNIRKATTFDYNAFRAEQTQRESRRRKQSIMRPVRAEDSGMKVTSIRGWNHEEDASAHLPSLQSYAW